MWVDEYALNVKQAAGSRKQSIVNVFLFKKQDLLWLNLDLQSVLFGVSKLSFSPYVLVGIGHYLCPLIVYALVWSRKCIDCLMRFQLQLLWFDWKLDNTWGFGNPKTKEKGVQWIVCCRTFSQIDNNKNNNKNNIYY